jgi:putative salt-induced outer membrane protein YdiY
MNPTLSMCIVLSGLLAGAAPNAAAADVVRLVNGDRLTGEVVRLEKSELVLKTVYAGDIRVKWEEVACVTSDHDLTFLLKTGEVLTGRPSCPEGGKMQIVGERPGTLRELSLADLEAVNLSPPPPVAYKARITAGGSTTDGNTNTTAFNSSADFEARSEHNRFTVRGKANYGESDGSTTENNALGSLKYDHFLTKKLYAYAQSLFEYDKLQDLNLRTTLSVGPGYQILDTDRAQLFAEAGLSYVNEDFENEEDNSYAAARWSLGLEVAVVPKRVKFFHRNEGYWSLKDADSYLIRTEQGLRFALVDNFFANLEYDYMYNNEPAPGTKSSDTAFIFGLGYEYNF